MAHSRMDEFSVAIDPTTGELVSNASRPRVKGLQVKSAWKPVLLGAGIVLALVLVAFMTALLLEL
jgi:hypothetical protein